MEHGDTIYILARLVVDLCGLWEFVGDLFGQLNDTITRCKRLPFCQTKNLAWRWPNDSCTRTYALEWHSTPLRAPHPLPAETLVVARTVYSHILWNRLPLPALCFKSSFQPEFIEITRHAFLHTIRRLGRSSQLIASKQECYCDPVSQQRNR